MHLLALALSLCSLLCALSPALAVPTRTSVRKSGRSSSSFVTTSGTGFSVDDKDFTFVGTNAYWLPYLNNDDDISNTLANMSQAGITVLRTWAFNDVTTIPDTGSWLQLIKDGTTTINMGENGIQRLDRFIQLAKKYNIYVYFALTNNWNPSVAGTPTPVRRNGETPTSLPRNFLSNDYGGMDAYVREFGVNKTHDEFFTNEEIRDKFNSYVQFIVSRYADEPGVIAWELANDARCFSTLAASDQCNSNVVTQWHAETARFVRSVDSDHLITSGNHGFFCPTCPKLFTKPPPPQPSSAPVPDENHKRTSGGLMTPSRFLRMVAEERRAAPRVLGAREGVKIRGRWTAPNKAKRQTGGIGPAFSGFFGVDSEDILNAPDIDFGTFQLFPDQVDYEVTGSESQAPTSDFNNTLSQTTAWIRAQAESARAIGKPVVLSAFGLITEDNLAQFIPFNATTPLTQSQQQNWKRQDFGGVTTGTNQQQVTNAYTTWLQTGSQSGVSGMNQYQWSSQNLVPATGTFVQSSTPGGTVGTSPNDGYGILGTDETQVQQVLTNATRPA